MAQKINHVISTMRWRFVLLEDKHISSNCFRSLAAITASATHLGITAN